MGSPPSRKTSTTLVAGSYATITATFVDNDGGFLGATGTNTVALTVNAAPTTFSTTVNGSTSAVVDFGAQATLAESGINAAATGDRGHLQAGLDHAVHHHADRGRW